MKPLRYVNTQLNLPLDPLVYIVQLNPRVSLVQTYIQLTHSPVGLVQISDRPTEFNSDQNAHAQQKTSER